MKKMDKRWTIRLSALALSAVLLGTVAALATGGDQTDPLITLSYLNQTAIPQIVQQGCELLPRIGTVMVQSNTAPALIDLSAGGTVNSGTALTQNHLYMATIIDRTLTASGGEAKLLVRGSYSVR